MKVEQAPYAHSTDYKERRIDKETIHNYSDLALERALSYFPANLLAEQIVIMPDFNPGRSVLPSGCSVEIDTNKDPRWRRFLLSDIGCGMQVYESSLKWDDFEEKKPTWDLIYGKLKANKGKLGDLGSGNHFLDAAVDDEENVYFVIHTGSRNESVKVDPFVNDPIKFDKEYERIQKWARNNRTQVALELLNLGEINLLFDKPHNTYRQEDNKVVIYKGTVRLEPGEKSLIPSSMDGDMVIVSGNDEELAKINYTMAHGTGRYKSRGDAKEEAYNYDFAALRKRIYIPEAIPNESILTENPSCYRDLDLALDKINDLITVEKRLVPIAYIGQI